MKTVRPVIASNWVPCRQMRSIGSHSTSGKEKEGHQIDNTEMSKSRISLTTEPQLCTKILIQIMSWCF